MNTHGQLPNNRASNGRETIGSAVRASPPCCVLRPAPRLCAPVPTRAVALCPQLVVETSTASFHGNTEDTVVTYRWQGDRIWPSSEFLSQDTATRVHAAAAR